MKILIATLLLISGVANASRYTYFPESQLYPGSGFDLFRPDNAFPDCVDSDGIESGNHEQGSQASDTSRVSLKLLKTREDFYQFINFSASMGGSYKFFSGSASYSMEQEDKFHSDSITWGIIFETNYGIYKLKNPRLKSQYKNLNSVTLRAKCGNEVVLKSRKAVSVFATFTLKNVEASHRSEIIKKANISMSGAVWGANMQGAYTNILRTAMARSQLELEVFAVGGRGIVDLKELATTGSKPGESPYDLFARVPEIIGDYIATLKESQSAPVEFFTGDITSLNGTDDGEGDSLHAKQISRMYLDYLDAEANHERIRTILTVDRKRYVLDDQIVRRLESDQKDLNDVMNRIETAALSCKDPKKACAVPSLSLPDTSWPNMLYDRCERQREIAMQEGCISEAQAATSRLKNEVPACSQHDVDSPFELVGWARCSN